MKLSCTTALVGILTLITSLTLGGTPPSYLHGPAHSLTAATDTIRINFADQSTPAPAGYLPDFGLGYAIQTGYTYGWVDPGSGTPLSLVGNGRNRGPFPDVDPLLETLLHMQFGDTGSGNGVPQEGAWEIALPNGAYRVTVTAGDSDVENRVGTTHVLNVENLNVLYQPTTYGAVNQFTGSIVVEVTDGRLTIDPLGGYNTKINTVVIAPATPEPEAFCSHPNPADGATGVPVPGFQITVSINVPAGYELDQTTLTGNVRLFEQSDAGLVEVPSNANDTGGGDAITLTPNSSLKAATTYVFLLEGLEANRIGDLNDRIVFRTFSSQFTTAAEADTTPPANLDGVAFTQVSGDLLGAGTADRFTTLTIGPDGKLYASTLSNVIKRWTILPDGTLTNLEELTVNLQPSPHPVTGVLSPDPRLIIGLVFSPTATAGNLEAYVTHSALTLTDGPEWDGKLTRLSGPQLENAQDILEHLPRSKKDHLTNSLVFGPNDDLFFLQGSNTAGGEPDILWGMRLERLLSAAVLRLNLAKLPASLPLSVYTTNDISVINQAPATGLTLADGTYNPYAQDSPLTLYATGIRNAYDLVFHSNGWLYIPTNGTAGNNNNSPNAPASNIYVARDTSGVGIRRPNGTYFTDPTIPGVEGGETQKDWLFKSQGGSYHGHPNPYRGQFVLNHGGIPYSGLPGQLIDNYRDVSKYPADLPPDPNYREVAYDFGMNKSPNGVIEYQSAAFGGKLQGMLLVARFSGQDDIIVLQPGNNSGDIIEAFQDVPGLQSLDDPLDIIEHTPSGNLYVSQYDRGGDGHEMLILMRVADPNAPAPQIAASAPEAILQATIGEAGAETDDFPLTISNTGQQDLHVTSVLLTGVFATQFSFTGPETVTLPPGQSQAYTVHYAPNPDNSAPGHQPAELVFNSDGNLGAPFRIGLHGLKTLGYGGANEPPLQEVVDVVGVTIDVGWTDLTTDPQAPSLGDEVAVEWFAAAGAGPVLVRPLARYSSAESLPFGYFTHTGGQVSGTEVGVAASSLAESQTLFPELSGGGTSFTPPADPFGFYVFSAAGNQHTYSEQALNGAGTHRVRVYPVLDRDGKPVADHFLICFDIDGDGDYQDYVLQAENVVPFQPPSPVLGFSPDNLNFVVSHGGAAQSLKSLIGASGGTAGDAVILTASEPWVVLPPSAAVGDSATIAVDPPGLAQGTYQATVTASAQGYTPAELTLTATVTESFEFSARINFQDNTFSPPAGYTADIGLPFGDQNGLQYGWINPATKDPQDNTAAARGADRQVTETSPDENKLLHSFNMLDWRKQDPPVPRDWEIAVPNGIYLVELAAGDPSSVDSRHTIRAEGVILVSDFIPSYSDYYRTGSGYVEVTDGRLTIDDNGAQGVGNSKLIYVTLEKFDPGTPTGAFVRIENLTKAPFNNRSLPGDDFFSFNRLDQPYNGNGQLIYAHDENVARIHNDGTAPLLITDLTTTSPEDFAISGINIPPGGLSVAPGDHVDATITFVTTGLPGQQLITEKLVLESNADNQLTTHVTLRGAFMVQAEGGNEITTEQAFNVMGFITEVARDENGNVIDRPSSDYPSDEEVNSGRMGDLILSRFYTQADPSQPVRVYQLVALHGPGYAPTELRDANRHPIPGFVFRHDEMHYQSLMPHNIDGSGIIAGHETPTIGIPFQIMIAGYSSAGGTVDGSMSDEILGMRAYKAVDRDGNVVPNEFLLVQDYIVNGCGAGTANCDFQDNVCYITNVRPVDVPSAGNIADFTVESLTPTDYRIDGSFQRGYAGNRLIYRANLSDGASLPRWMTLEGLTGTFTFTAPDAVVGQSFDIVVRAIDDNQRVVTSDFRLTVVQGTGGPPNQLPQAVASASPPAGTEPLTVTLDGGGSSDPDGFIETYQWAWDGGSATGVTSQVTFPAGSYSITLTVTDDQGGQDTDVVNVLASPPSTGDRTSSFWLEAECALVGGQWTTLAHAEASNSSYVVRQGSNSQNTPPPDVSENRVRFNLFDVEAGYYNLFARIGAPDGLTDSYWVRINSAEWIKWNSGMARGEGFSWNKLPGSLPFLVDGFNTIDFAFREAGTKLDKLHLDKDPALPVGMGENADNCGTSSNQPPNAVAVATPDSGPAPLNVQLDATGSTDPDGTIVQYDWNWNGGSASGSLASATFNAGVHDVTLTVTDDAGTPAFAVVTITATGPPGGEVTATWLEAECAAVGSNWESPPDGGASNGLFVRPTTGSPSSTPPPDLPENRIRFVINNLEAGSYHLFARISAPDGNSDSYWVRVNGESWFKWNSGILRSGGFAWNRYPGGLLTLATGTNTLDFAYREAGTALDKIHLDQDSALPTGLGDPATNCTPNDDTDGDGVANAEDNCPDYYNPDQSLPTFYADFDGDGYGDPNDSLESCPTPANYVTNNLDNCPAVYATDLTDSDGDGLGDACDPDTPPAESFALEAECGTAGSDWQIRASSSASGNQYRVFTGSRHTSMPTDSDPAQELTFTVSTATAANYHLFLRVNAPDGGRNSVWIKVNDGSWIKMWKEIGGGQLLTSGFEWRKVNDDGVDLSFPLTAGNHLITVANREPGTEVDKLLLSVDPTLPTGYGLAATNCAAPGALAAPGNRPAAGGMERTVESELTVHPNPTHDELNIRWQSRTRGVATMVVTDLAGRRVLEVPLHKETEELHYRLTTEYLPPGTYRLVIHTATERPRTILFVRL
ncbi:hypothetical protein GGR26_002270 [Lewinella marina]|uniref:PKD domain-containing protein n=1 Tax=Neolewinella marina TaxID=438751 RepID=A0A2G0CGE5_9BACT|nr:PKD domain-containing protein [Neolewinella marina]NJB86502.1 hypothetical protein [Neolewinella marina]PHK99041.1 hypothetical protein CGL56_06160 [Neolewinella marina]